MNLSYGCTDGTDFDNTNAIAALKNYFAFIIAISYKLCTASKIIPNQASLPR